MKRRKIVSVIALVLAVLMLLGLFVSMIPYASAAKSDEIQDEIDELKDKAKDIDEKQEALQAEIDANELEKAGIIERKSALDREMNLLLSDIENTNLLIEKYDELIEDKQIQLRAAKEKEDELYSRYKMHIRYIEENGSVSYFAVLFHAKSFSDFLDKLEWIRAISAADQNMMNELTSVKEEILSAQDELFAAEAEIELQRTELQEQQAELEKKTEETQILLNQLSQTTEEMQLVWNQYDEMEQDVEEMIAQKQKEYEKEKAKEEEEKRKAEQERIAEEARRRAESGGGSGSGSGGGSGSTSTGFIRPVAGGYITSPYGMRIHPITGVEKMHNGVDYGVPYGTPIYAAASGTVYWAGYDSEAGNWVMINHSGYLSTAYMHMSSYNVGCGQWVNQGQVIGYVGSTGASTGAHLHFSMYYKGCFINPCTYVGYY